MPESVTPKKHCGTYTTGYISGGTHPATVGQTNDANVCFHNDSSKCTYKYPIKIRNCGLFFIYELPDVHTCFLGYCAE